MCHDIARVLMAVSKVLGIWEDEMRVPAANRELLVQRNDRNMWDLDARGYPIPSDILIAECDLLLRRELDERYKS